jgi:hypothetical protein
MWFNLKFIIMQDWNPGFTDKDGNFHPYEKRWYCNHNKIIHGSEKEYKNCKYCNSENKR